MAYEQRPLQGAAPLSWQPLGPGFRRGGKGDGYDGDAQGSRFWAVRHSPLGEAPFSAPQAKKIWGPQRSTPICLIFGAMWSCEMTRRTGSARQRMLAPRSGALR